MEPFCGSEESPAVLLWGKNGAYTLVIMHKLALYIFQHNTGCMWDSGIPSKVSACQSNSRWARYLFKYVVKMEAIIYAINMHYAIHPELTFLWSVKINGTEKCLILTKLYPV